MRSLTVSFFMLAVACFAPALLSQDQGQDQPAAEPAPEEKPTRLPRRELDEVLSDGAAKRDFPNKYGYIDPVVFPQTLFDGEHLRPYERRGDDKRYAILGSWAVDARFGLMMAESGKSRDGWDARARVRFGFVGAEFSFTSLDQDDASGPSPQTLEDIASLRLTFDLDFTENFTLRPVLGWASLDHDADAFDDDTVCFGAEWEILPLRPISLEGSLVGFRSPAAGTTFWDGYIGIGIYPMALSSEPQSWWPVVRVGMRRIVGPAQFVGTTMWVVDVGIGF